MTPPLPGEGRGAYSGGNGTCPAWLAFRGLSCNPDQGVVCRTTLNKYLHDQVNG